MVEPRLYVLSDVKSNRRCAMALFMSLNHTKLTRNFFMTTSSTTFTQCAPEATEFGEITQNKGRSSRGVATGVYRYIYPPKISPENYFVH